MSEIGGSPDPEEASKNPVEVTESDPEPTTAVRCTEGNEDIDRRELGAR